MLYKSKSLTAEYWSTDEKQIMKSFHERDLKNKLLLEGWSLLSINQKKSQARLTEQCNQLTETLVKKET